MRILIKKYLLQALLIISFSSSFLLIPSYVRAEVQVTEDILSDTTWSADQSPYRISKNIIIASSTTLTIEPGTTIIFGSNTLTIFGSLHAEGLSDNKITFTSDNIPWGLAFIQGSQGDVSNSIFQFMNKGIQVQNSILNFKNVTFSESRGIQAFSSSNLYIASTTFSQISRDAVTLFGSSTASLGNVDFENINGAGLIIYNSSNVVCTECTFDHIHNVRAPTDAISVYNSGSLILKDSHMEDAGDTSALAVFDFSDGNPAHVDSEHSEFVGTNQNGIMAYGRAELVLNNTNVSNYSESGLTAFQDAVLHIASSTFTKNTVGITLYNAPTGEINRSSILGNTQFGIQSFSSKDFNAINNWWGSPTGPRHALKNPIGTGDSVSDGITFVPWVDHDPDSKPVCCSNVVFIPGIEGSRLYKKGLLYEDQLWEPNINSDVKDLYLDKQGKSINPSIYTRDVIAKTNYPAFNIDVYQKFSELMDSLVNNQIITNWKSYPYDWRLSIKDIVSNGSLLKDGTNQKLTSVIENLASASKTKKVTIIAHSYGGLVAKQLVHELEKENKTDLIDKIIFVASPQLGTPVAIPILLHGYNQALAGGLLLKASTARQLAENSPMAYSLLPAHSYSSRIPFVQFDSSISSISNLYSIYGDSITKPDTLYSFIMGTTDRRTKPSVTDMSNPNIGNSALLADAENIHKDIDTVSLPADIKTIEIAGTNKDTPISTRYFTKSSFICILSFCKKTDTLDYQPIISQDGDGTVPTQSAITNFTNDHYYIDLGRYNDSTKENRSHADILEISSVQKLIKNLIQIGTSSKQEFISTLNPLLSTDGLQVSTHSPVTLDLYDEAHLHTGIGIGEFNNEADIYDMQIPNSYYMPFGEGIYAGVKSGTTTLVLKGTDVGTFTLDIKNTFGTSTFKDIPVLPFSEITSTIGTNSIPSLNIDFDGDGIIDSVISSGITFDPITYLYSIKSVITTFKIDQNAKDKLNKRIDKIIKQIQSGKIQHAEAIIRNNLKKIKIGNKKKGQILSTDERQLLVNSFTNLLDNLEN